MLFPVTGKHVLLFPCFFIAHPVFKSMFSSKKSLLVHPQFTFLHPSLCNSDHNQPLMLTLTPATLPLARLTSRRSCQGPLHMLFSPSERLFPQHLHLHSLVDDEYYFTFTFPNCTI
jgi:hypothetical protein